MVAPEKGRSQSDGQNQDSRPGKRPCSPLADPQDDELSSASKYRKLFSGVKTVQKDAEHSRGEELRLRDEIEDRDDSIQSYETQVDSVKAEAKNTKKALIEALEAHKQETHFKKSRITHLEKEIVNLKDQATTIIQYEHTQRQAEEMIKESQGQLSHVDSRSR